MAARCLSQRQTCILQWLTTDHQRTRGMLRSSHQDLVRAVPADKGNISHSLHTLEARGLMVIGRSSGGKAKSDGSPRRGSNGPRSWQKVVNKEKTT